MPSSNTTAALRQRILRPTWLRAMPFGIYLVFLALASALPLLPGVDARWLYPAKIGAVAVSLAILWHRFEELARPRWTIPEVVWACVAGVAVFAAWISLDVSWASIANGKELVGFDPRRNDGSIEWLLALPRLAGAALVVPVMEELFWRSLVMRWLDSQDFLRLSPASTSVGAMLASSVLFGLEHDLWLAGILAGIAYGELYRRSGNLWTPILAHATTNLLLGLWVLGTGTWKLW